jgi:hypothetical protein
VPPTLGVDPETNQLLAVVLDDRVLADTRVAADDELFHATRFARSAFNRFGTAGRRRKAV